MKVSCNILLVFGVVLAVLLYLFIKPSWDYDHLEQNARKAITGAELQAWATNLLAHHPAETHFSVPQLGTNFPPQLRTLCRLGPHVFICIPDDTNQPSFVQLYWGGGLHNDSGFLVGPTNFSAADNDAHQWQPGVWFYRRN